MVDTSLPRPDITLTLDRNGVIRDAISSDSMAEEGIASWRGKAWGQTTGTGLDAEISKMIAQMRGVGGSSCIQVTQRFPSGRELPMEYTAVSLGGAAGFIAVGKNIQTISDLQARLANAQQAQERDYWKIREIETRYRTLFDSGADAAALVRVTNLRVVEVNLAATKSLGLLPGPEFFPDLDNRDRKSLEATLTQVRLEGRAPGVALRLSPSQGLWSLRASLMKTEADSFYLFQMTPLGAKPAFPEPVEPASTDELIRRLPDGFAIVDRGGTIQSANNTFLDLAQVGAESAVVGQSMKRWLSTPGADISVLLNLVSRHGSVRAMRTVLMGDLGSTTPVEISAVGEKYSQPERVAMLIRDVTTRTEATETRLDSPSGADLETAPPLEQIVGEATQVIERKWIAAVLEHSQGNRTMAAKKLGLSRQSLHAKLKKYNFEAK